MIRNPNTLKLLTIPAGLALIAGMTACRGTVSGESSPSYTSEPTTSGSISPSEVYAANTVKSFSTSASGTAMSMKLTVHKDGTGIFEETVSGKAGNVDGKAGTLDLACEDDGTMLVTPESNKDKPLTLSTSEVKKFELCDGQAVSENLDPSTMLLALVAYQK